MVKKKVSLGSSPDLETDARDGAGAAALPQHRAATVDVLELFFNTGIILHDVAMPRGLPDTVSSFIVMPAGGASAGAAPLTDPRARVSTTGPSTLSVRRAGPGEDPDVEISAHDHLTELSN